MPDEDDILGTPALDLMIWSAQEETDLARARAEMAAQAKQNTDDARVALAMLAEPAIKVIAARLEGAPAEGGQGALKAGEFPIDDAGRPITKEREDTAWEVLARIGVPRLRATAVAAPLAAAPQAVAPGSPGWVAPELEDAEDVKELDPASLDGQIQAFMSGVKAARDLDGDT